MIKTQIANVNKQNWKGTQERNTRTSKDFGSARFKKAKKQLVLTNNPYETFAGVDNLMDISGDRPQHRTSPK